MEETLEWFHNHHKKKRVERMKFRAWVPSAKKMVYQDNFFEWIDGGMLGVEFTKDGMKAEYHTDGGIDTDIVLLMYTGLEDLSGVWNDELNDRQEGLGIYEGDFVFVQDYYENPVLCSVIWDDYTWTFENDGKEFYGTYGEYNRDNLSCAVVVGNIYETPELATIHVDSFTFENMLARYEKHVN